MTGQKDSSIKNGGAFLRRQALVMLVCASILILLASTASANLVFNSRTGSIDFNTAATIKARFGSDGNLGINTGLNAIPNKLSVIGDLNVTPAGTGAPSLFIRYGDGNVGIGTATPGTKLDVTAGEVRFDGNILFTNDVKEYYIKVGRPAVTYGPAIRFRGNGSASTDRDLQIGSIDGSGVWVSRYTFSTGANRIGVGTTNPQNGINVIGDLNVLTSATATPSLYVNSTDGNVGVNETTPDVRLHVTAASGDANVLRVDSSGGAGLFVVRGDGNVGVGTAVPVSKLHITVDGNQGVIVTDSDANGAVKDAVIATRNFVNAEEPVLLVYGRTDANTSTSVGNLLSFGGTDQGLRFNAANVISFFTAPSDTNTIGGTERLRIAADGNVGIGTSAPLSPMHVVGNITVSSGSGLYRHYSGTTLRSIIDNSTAGITRIRPTDNAATDGIRLEDWSGNAALFVRQDGNVGIGTTDPIARLEVEGASGDANVFQVQSSADATLFAVRGDGNVGVGTAIPVSKLHITVDANQGVIVTDSDANGVVKDAVIAARNFVNAEEPVLLVYGRTDANTSTSSGNIVSIGGTDQGLRFNAANVISFFTAPSDTNTIGGTERVRITADGNVGIGTTTPTSNIGWAKTLDLTGASGSNIALVLHNAGTTGEFAIAIGSGGTFFDVAGAATASNNYIAYRTEETNSQNSPTERMRITSDGNVGIGTTDPIAKLEVEGASGDANVFQVQSSADATLFAVRGDGNVGVGTAIPASKLHITVDGNQGVIVTDSDANGVVKDAVIATRNFVNAEEPVLLVYGRADANTSTSVGNLLSFGGTDQGLRFNAANVISFFTAPSDTNTIGGTERLRIAADGNVGIGTTTPAAKLDIDTGSNNSGLRLRGTAETVEIADLYVDSGGQLVISNTAGTDTSAWIDLRSEDDQYGVLIRESDGTGTDAYLNTYVVDAATDYANLVVDDTGTSPGLVITQSGLGGNVGIKDISPDALLDVNGINLNSDVLRVDANGNINPLVGLLVDKNGQVGVGTAAPQTFIEFSSPTVDGAILLLNSTSLTQGNRAALFLRAANVNGNSGVVSIEAISVNNQQNEMAFRTGGTTITAFGTERMRITTDGNVGIGTTTPQRLLVVAGAHNTTTRPEIGLRNTTAGTTFTGNIDWFNGNGVLGWQIANNQLSGTDYLEFNNAGSNRGGITSDGNFIMGGPTTATALINARNRLTVVGDLNVLTSAGATPSLYVNSTDGNVGIGTTSPAAKLHIEVSDGGNVNETLRLYNNNNTSGSGNRLSFYGGTSPVPSASVEGSFTGSNLGILAFRTRDASGLTERMRINSDGNVGIGETSPLSRVHIQASDVNNARLIIENTAGGTMSFAETTASGGNTFAFWRYGATPLLQVEGITLQTEGTNAGSVGIGDTTPDANLEVVSRFMVSATAAGDGDRLIVATDGNVGIGTTTPKTVLNVVGDVNFQSYNRTTPAFRVDSNTAGASVPFVIDKNGWVGIGTASPGRLLEVGVTGAGSTVGIIRYSHNVGGNQRSWDVGIGESASFGANDNFGIRDSSGGNTRLVINTDGNVGIGTTTPAAKLHIQVSDGGNVNETLRLYNNNDSSGSGNRISFYGGTTPVVSSSLQGAFTGSNLGTLAFSTRDASGLTERMRIASDGNVGIRTTTPNAGLHLKQAQDTNFGGIRFERASTTDSVSMFIVSGEGSLNDPLVWRSSFNGLVNMAIDRDGNFYARGNVGIGTTSALYPLHVSRSGAESIVYVAGDSTQNTGFQLASTNYWRIINPASTSRLDIRYGASNPPTTTALSILNDGNVGIGTTTPTYGKLQVAHPGNDGNLFNGVTVDYGTSTGTVRGFYSLAANGFVNASIGLQMAATEGHMLFYTAQGKATTEKMRITPDGNVGIGTTTPAARLQLQGAANDSNFLSIVNSAGTSRFTFTSTLLRILQSPPRIEFMVDGNTSLVSDIFTGGGFPSFEGETVRFQIRADQGPSGFRVPLSLSGKGIEFMATGDGGTAVSAVIRSDGNVGIGTTTPDVKLQLDGNFLPEQDAKWNIGSGALRWNSIFASNGTIQTSDARLKTNIEGSVLGLDFIRSLRPVTYNWVQGDSTIHYGFLAQEVEKAAGSITAPGVQYDQESDRYGLNYAELIAPTVKAVQELDSGQQDLNKVVESQQDTIAEQAKKIKELEQKLEAEKKRNDSQDARLKAVEEKLGQR